MIKETKQYLGQVLDDLKTCYGFKIPKLKQQERKLLHTYDLADFFSTTGYDSKQEIFENKTTCGFILRVPAKFSMGSQSQDSITQLISYDVPEFCAVQVINFASPYIENLVDNWVLSGSKGGMLGELARRRGEFFKQKAHTINADDNFGLRDFEIYYCFSVPKSKQEALRSIRDKVKRTLKSVGGEILDITSKELSVILSKMLSPTGDYTLELHPEFVLSRSARSVFKYLIFEVTKYPREREIADSINYVGDFQTGRGIAFPFWISFGFKLSEMRDSESKARNQRIMKTNQANGKAFALFPKFAEETEEWHFVSERIDKGEKLGKAVMHVVVRVDGNANTHDAKQAIVDHFYRQKFELEHVKHDVLNALISTLPFGVAENWTALNRQGVATTMLTSSCINLLPCFADGQNYIDSLLMFVGRRGQLFFWDCFDDFKVRGMGSFNTVFVGIPGSGKSVLIQEFTLNILRKTGQVVIIDDGKSSEDFCKVSGGSFVDFESGDFCINPFSFFIDKEGDESSKKYKKYFRKPFIDLVLTILCVILNIDKNDKNTFKVGKYRKILTRAIEIVLAEKGRKGGFADIRNVLLHNEELRTKENIEVANDMAFCLTQYATGEDAAAFNGEATLKIDGDLTVFELGSLESDEVLQTCVLVTVIFVVYMQMRRRDRRTSLVIDEAWKTIAHPAIAGFLKGISKRARKYNSNIVTATQNLSDFAYTESPAAAAVFANSDWKIIFSVEGKDEEMLKKDLKMSDWQIEQVKRLSGVQGKYSECMIIHKSGYWCISRLILDPFSIRLYSSTADDVVKLDKLKDQGYSTKQAIEMLIERERMHV